MDLHGIRGRGRNAASFFLTDEDQARRGLLCAFFLAHGIGVFDAFALFLVHQHGHAGLGQALDFGAVFRRVETCIHTGKRILDALCDQSDFFRRKGREGRLLAQDHPDEVDRFFVFPFRHFGERGGRRKKDREHEGGQKHKEGASTGLREKVDFQLVSIHKRLLLKI